MPSAVTGTKVCSIVPGRRSLGSSARKREAFDVYARASSATPPSSVAEKSIVWRFVGTRAEDAVDLRLEAHVEHAVGLVEDERADRVELDQPLLEQVVEAAGCRDEHVRGARLLRLRADGHAAVDGRDAQALRLGERPEVGCDLGRELARRDEHERGRLAAGAGRALDERQAEGERLAGAGRRLGEDVEAAERVREHELLDGERAVDVAGAEGPHNGCAHAERLERLGHAVLLLVLLQGFEMRETRYA